MEAMRRRRTRLRAWSGITGWRFESSSAHHESPANAGLAPARDRAAWTLRKTLRDSLKRKRQSFTGRSRRAPVRRPVDADVHGRGVRGGSIPGTPVVMKGQRGPYAIGAVTDARS